MDSENSLQQYVKQILADNPFRLVLSGADSRRETLRRLSNGYQAERIVNRQAFQTNLTVEEMYLFVLSRFEEGYRQLTHGANPMNTTCVSRNAAGRCSAARRTRMLLRRLNSTTA